MRRIPQQRQPGTPIRLGTYAGAGVVAAAYALTLAASIAYDRGATAVNSRDFAAARSAFDTAVALDPSMAIYVRERGELNLISGRPDAAVADLLTPDASTRRITSPSRALGLALSAAGDEVRAGEAFDRALNIQRAIPPTCCWLPGGWLKRGTEEATTILSETVQLWPAIVAAPSWSELLPQGVTTADVAAEAAERWETGQPTPEVMSDQGVWLAALADRPSSTPAPPATLRLRLRSCGSSGVCRPMSFLLARQRRTVETRSTGSFASEPQR